MGATVYKRCDECGRWVHRDETVLRQPGRTKLVDRIRSIKTSCSNNITNSQPPNSTFKHPNIPRRICLFCVDNYDAKQAPLYARLAATGSDTRTSGSGRRS
jgi:hypothetical protein